MFQKLRKGGGYINDTKEVVDAAKLLTSVAPVGLTILGMPIETWSFIVSITVGLFYLVEKLPAVLESLTELRKRYKRG